MKVIVDDKIPYIREAIEKMAEELVYAPGRSFTPALVKDADALIIRTRTQCNKHLLDGSKVRFIATATIGFDHIDPVYCKERGITWTNAPGCNASSVAQYLQSVLLLLQKEKGMHLPQLTLGIVGKGHVGSKVLEVATSLGMHTLVCDPPLAVTDTTMTYSSLKEVAEQCDIITFHVPLSKEGPYKTWHLADSAFMHSLQRHPILINTSRGEVIDTSALKQALASGRVSDAVLDVWEHEPDIDRGLLDRVFIGTPHIAGYSADGKANATRQALTALGDYFGRALPCTVLPPPPAHPVIHAANRCDALLQIYDPRDDSHALKSHPELFEQLRGNYPIRREEEAFQIIFT